MADTPVAALDHTIQQTNIWLKTLPSSCISKTGMTPTARYGRCCTFCAIA